MKILWVKPGKLLPLDTGGKLRSYNILRKLSALHQVTFLSYYGGLRDEKYETEILQHLPGTVPIYTASPHTPGISRYADYLLRLAQPAPYAVSRFSSLEVRRAIMEWMQPRRCDVAICDFLASTLNFPQDLSVPTVLFQHNVETVLWKRRAKFATKWTDRVISNIEYAKMARFERIQVRRFHHVLAVSEQDRQAMSGMVDPSRISVIPTGVDLDKYRYDPEAHPVSPLVVFTGSMDWEPNIDGVEYFCKHIWPHILASIPEARFRIVGRDPHARVRRLISSSVEVTGTVPSIVEHLRDAAVLVVPLRIGGGTRIKIYEGMAMGKATVSTSVGAEGLDIRHGHDIFLADDPKRFAGYVVRLLQDQEFRRECEAAAATAMRHCDWSLIAERFARELERTIRAATTPNAVSVA